MGFRRREGIVRRPIEYVLVAMALLLIIMLLWLVYSLRAENEKQNGQARLSNVSQPITGTIDEIDWLTDQDVHEERIYDKLLVGDDAATIRSIDAAYDNIASAIDETALPQDICSELSSIIQKKDSSFEELIAVTRSSYDATKVTIQERIDRMMTSVQLTRRRNDQRREESFTLLDKRSSAENSELVRTFGQQIETAVSLRRQLFDVSRLEFTEAIQKQLQERVVVMDIAVLGYKSRVDEAIVTARRICARKNADVSAVRAELSRQINEARLTYADALRARPDISQLQKDVETKRNGTYKEAITQFEQTIKRLQVEYAELRF